MTIIGITGMLGAGKGEVVKYLKERGFKHYSARDFITEEMVRRGLPIDRNHMTDTANDLRKTHGPSYITEALYAQAVEGKENAIIESVHALAEVEALRAKENFILFGVDADPHLRYERIQKRKSATDNVTFEKFLADEAREDKNTDPTKGNLSACLSKADYVFSNDGTIDELHAKVDEVLTTLKI